MCSYKWEPQTGSYPHGNQHQIILYMYSGLLYRAKIEQFPLILPYEQMSNTMLAKRRETKTKNGL